MTSSLRLQIIGAGVCGTLLAWSALREGYNVEIFEARHEHDVDGAGFVAAAMLAPLAEAAHSETIIGALGLAAMPLWADIIATLNRDLNVPIFFQRDGTLVIWHPHDRAEAQLFSRQLSQTLSPLANANPDQAPSTERLDADTLLRTEPMIAERFQENIFLKGEGQLDNLAFIPAIRAAIKAMGGMIHWQNSQTPEQLASTSSATIVDCRGFGAKRDWTALQFPPAHRQLRGVRGEVLRVHSREVHLKRPIRLLHPRYPLYIAPKPHQEFVIGATVIESEDESPMSLQSCMELASALYTVHPAFAEARILAAKTALRPTLTDHRPCIATRKNTQQPIIYINGLYRHGWLLAPIVVKSAMSLILQLTTGSPSEAWRSKQAFPALFSFIE